MLVSGNALNRCFDYDPIYRLLAATGRECDLPSGGEPWQDQPRCTDLTRSRAYTEQYRYDAMGNMLRLGHRNEPGGFTREFTIEAANNRLREMKIGNSTFGYTFDANGNMRSETASRHFEWNHSDQMKAFRTQTEGAEPSVYAHYLYDAVGQRVKKLVRKQGGQVEVTHYIDGVFEHHRWVGQLQAGEYNHVHVLDDKQRIALVRFGAAHPDDRGPAVQFHLGDHLGSSNVVVDSTGAMVNREEFTPYGETSFGSFARKRYRFTGKERDEESGLNYHGARYLAQHLARWISADPAGPMDGANLYDYVTNRVTVAIDPNGMIFWIVVPFIVFALVTDNCDPSPANAPGPKTTTLPSHTTEDSAKRWAVVVASVAVGGVVASKVSGAATSRVGETFGNLIGDSIGAGTGNVANTAGMDLVHGELSSPGKYVESFASGAVVGGVVGLVARSRNASSPTYGSRLGESQEAHLRTLNEVQEPNISEPSLLGPAPEKPAAPNPTGISSQIAPKSRWGNWDLKDLMTGSKYKPTQRDIFRGTVEEMADAMKAGKFDWAKAELDPIILDPQGTIMQGHHRIVAARLAGKQIPNSASRLQAKATR